MKNKLFREASVMLELTSQDMTLEDYLAYQPEEDGFFELENGRLLQYPAESDLNRRIEMFLFFYFFELDIPYYRLRLGTEIVTAGRTACVRVPDFMVLSEEAAFALEGKSRATIILDMPSPELVVEVVSPGKENIDRDYRYKRSQYQAREISEYWIVDPLTEQITIFTMNEGLYDEAIYSKQDEFSTALMQRFQPEAKLSVKTVLQITEAS